MEKIEYIELIKDSKVVHISTQTTSSILLNGDYKSKVSYDVRGYLNFEGDDSIEYITLQMPYAVMCNSNYIVNQYNNTFVVEDYLGPTITAYTIPQGNYNSTSLITYLYTILTKANGWTITANTTTNIFTFSRPGAEFRFLKESTCDYILGFSGNVVSSGGVLVMPRNFNFLPIPRYIVHCNILNDGIILGENSKIAGSDILASIPNVARPNGQIIYENNASEFLVKNLNFGIITVSITDDNNRLINFNGISSYFVLKFNIFRRSIKKPMRFESLVEHINKIPLEEQQLGNEEL